MDAKSVFNLVGYVVGAVICAGVLYAGLIKRVKLLIPIPFVVFGAALVIQTIFQPSGIDNRLLSYLILCGAMTAALSIRTTHVWRYRVIEWAVNVLAILTVVDAVIHAGRSETLNPNLSAAILLLGVPWGSAYLILAGLVATQSRGALIGLATAAVVAKGRRARLPLIAILVLVVGGGVALRPGTVAARFDHWREAWRLFVARPLAGWGPGSYLAVSTIPNQNHADSALLTVLAEQGVIGALALVPLVVAVVRRCRRLYGVEPILGLAGSLLALGVQNLVDDTWLWPWPALLLGINLAVLWRRVDENHQVALVEPDAAIRISGAPAAVDISLVE
jgi:O-antigen ligase